MKIWQNLEQQSEQWFKVRAGRPTASEFSRIMSPKGKENPCSWEDFAVELCTETIRPDEIIFAGNRHTDRGNELEPDACDLFAEHLGLDVRKVGFVTRDDGYIGCSPDRLIYINDEPVAGLEVKCPQSKKHGATLISDEMPDEHLPQVHGSMAVTGLKTWYFMSYCPGLQPFIKRIDANDYTAKMSDALDRFLIFYAKRRSEIMPILTGRRASKGAAIDTEGGLI